MENSHVLIGEIATDDIAKKIMGFGVDGKPHERTVVEKRDSSQEAVALTQEEYDALMNAAANEEAEQEAAVEIIEQETKKADQLANKKSTKVTGKRNRIPISMYYGMSKNGQYISNPISNTLVAGNDICMQNVLSNMFGQMVLQYDNRDLNIHVYGDMANSWFGKKYFRTRIGRLDVVRKVSSSIEKSYLEWLEEIHGICLQRLGIITKSNSADVDMHEIVRNESLPTIVGIAIGAPTSIDGEIGAKILGLLMDINWMSNETRVYVINVTNGDAEIHESDLYPAETVVVSAVTKEQSEKIFGDDRAAKGNCTKDTVWVRMGSSSSTSNISRLMVPSYANDKLSEIIAGKIRPNRCSFTRAKLHQLQLLHFN